MSIFHTAFNRLDQCLKERMRVHRTPAMVVALTDAERLAVRATLGYANLESQELLQPDSLFALGSVGKAFTALAMLQACEAGLVDLHAPVKQYLPWFEVQSPYPPITLHHLLTHSSGLPRGTDFSPDPRSEAYALRDLTVGFAPGTHFYYSDLGYKVLGLVLQAVSGYSYADWVRERILEPLEMQHTCAVTTNELRPRMAVGYRSLYDDRPAQLSHPLVPAAWVETDSGDGCMVSTAEDMAKFAQMLLNQGAGPHGRLISLSSYEKMVHPMIEDEGEAYGYGLYLFEDDGYHVAGHGGDVPGYQAYLWLDLDNRLASVVLMTEPYTPRASFLTLEFFRAASLKNALPDLPPLPNFTTVKDPEQYAGVYHGQNCELVIAAEDHHLYLACEGQRVVLEEREQDRFYADYPGWELFPLRFERDRKEVVVEVSYGPRRFVNERYSGSLDFSVPPEWLAYAGHYRAHNPWETNFRVYIRKNRLILCAPNGEEEYLVQLSPGCFRIGEEEYIPERLVFDQLVEGQALCATRSGCAYYRFFTP